MYYKTVGKNYYFNVQGNLIVRLHTNRDAISKLSRVDCMVAKQIYNLVEVPQEEYNTALQQILDTLKINKFNFQFNGKK
jgi:capsid portal protein